MNEHITPTSRIHRAGFTLAEILLAMLVFAIAITTILALLARSVETAQEILTKDEAIGLSSAVEDYMTSMPFYSEGGQLNAYDIVKNDIDLFAYRYRGNSLIAPRADGTLVPMTTPTGGEVVSGVRYLGNTPMLEQDTAALDSRLFRVKLSVSPANPLGDGALPENPNAGDPLEYNSAVLVVFAEFFPVPTVGFPLPATVEPVFSFNFAVRR